MQLILQEFILLAQNYLADKAEQKRAMGALQDVRMFPVRKTSSLLGSGESQLMQNHE